MSLYKKFKISFFLSIRQLKNANIWVNLLIIFIMIITFLNLVFISGILDGIVTGASNDLRNHYSGDLIITPEEDRKNITNSTHLINTLEDYPQINNKTTRYITGAKMEKDKNVNRPNVSSNQINATLVGVNFQEENQAINLANFLIEGNYNYQQSDDKILVGSGYLSQYESAISESSLEGVSVGDQVEITFKGNTERYEVGGILEAKFNEINSRVYINQREFQTLTGRSRHQTNEIAMKVEEPTYNTLLGLQSDLSPIVQNHDAQIETWKESQGQFFKDLSVTFQLLGGVIGAIGITVASITLFIVIFINAIARERYIGIMKGIGIKQSIIKLSYMIQSMFYAAIGSLIGFLILWFGLVPYFQKNPVDFPFSDGILDVTLTGVLIRVTILILTAIAAGFIPAHLIVRKNTIDSLLGR